MVGMFIYVRMLLRLRQWQGDDIETDTELHHAREVFQVWGMGFANGNAGEEWGRGFDAGRNPEIGDWARFKGGSFVGGYPSA